MKGISSRASSVAPAVLVLAVIAMNAVHVDAADCYSDISEDSKQFLFGPKTSYKYIKNTNVDPIVMPGCTTKQMWMFMRHGSRYPRSDPPLDLEFENLQKRMPDIRKEVLANYAAGRVLMCKNDVDNIDKWSFQYDILEEEKLTPSGEEECHDIGDRYSQRLPDLKHSYSPDKYTFRFTTASRTEKSCKHFAKGFLGTSEEANINYPLPLENDTLIRYYQSCSKWINEVDNNTATRIEKTKFIAGPEVKALIADVSTRLGYPSATPLSFEDIWLIYTECRYDKAVTFKNLSPWCAAFTPAELNVLEYIEDLDYYYKDGYGYEINWKQACNPVVDLYNYFIKIVNGETGQPYGIFYFTHSGSVAQLLTRFGLFNDTVAPTAANYNLQAARQFRTSRMLSFATNLVFVLSDCASAGFKVQAFVNERPVRLPGCTTDSHEACLFNEFDRLVRPIIEGCRFDAICENPVQRNNNGHRQRPYPIHF